MRQNNDEKKFSFNILDALIIVLVVFILAFSIYVFVLGRGFTQNTESAIVTISKAVKHIRFR